MSMPEFPQITPPISREDAINQIISSIAMEELGLSHIINAEGEKLQYVLGTIPGMSGPPATIEDILAVNKSIREVLQSAAETQAMLRVKLQNALSCAVMAGPTGPTGATGPTGPGVIVPYASGDFLYLSTTAEGTSKNAGVMGFGASSFALDFDNESIDLTDGSNYAFVVPREAVITDLSALFSTSRVVLLAHTVTVTAQLYESRGNSFTPIAGSETTLMPVLAPGLVPAGTILEGNVGNINATVAPDSRLLMVFRATAVGSPDIVAISGYGSGGVSLA